MTNILQEWKAACQARQQKQTETQDQGKWTSPGRGGKLYPEEYENYQGRRINAVDTQRFPTGYSPCPPNSAINIHLQNTYRMSAPIYGDQTRIQPRVPLIGNYHPYPQPTEPYNHLDDHMGHPLTSNDPSNPLRTNYPQVMLRQSSINSQLQHYSENQRLYPESMRQFSDFSRSYQDPRGYPRAMPNVNIPHEHRLFGPEVNNRSYQVYEDDSRQSESMGEMARQYHEPQRADNMRQNVEEQRMYHERLIEKQRSFGDSPRQVEGPRGSQPFQRPPLLTQRTLQEPSRVYRDLESDGNGFPGQERFSEASQEGSAGRVYNPNHFKQGRSLSVEVQYVAGPPPPREMIPLQGGPGPPQGSPRPLVARGLQANMHRLPPSNSVAHFRKPQGAFT